MCLELKDKIRSDVIIPDGVGKTIQQPVKREDPLRLALAQLDYRKSEIDIALHAETVPNLDEASLQDRLRSALRVLAQHH
jgi:hypothetical protein